MVDGEHVDGLAVVGGLPAGAAVRRVPAGDGLGASDVGESPDLSLGLPAVLGDQAIWSVRAGDRRETSSGVVVSGVIGY